MRKRISGIDIIKILAIITVICVHFFSYSGYYKVPLDEPVMYLEAFIKWFALSGVALFLLATGYLQAYKKLSLNYYKGIVPVLVSYFGISVIAVLVRYFHYGEHFTVGFALFQITNFTAGNYAWYVEMYIGLFLLIPFINIIIHNITKKQFLCFMITLMILVSLPQTINNFLLVHFMEYRYLIPKWWVGIYPLVPYFIGAYIRLYPIKIKKFYSFIGIICMLCIQTLLTAYASHKGFDNHLWNDISTIFMVCQTTFTFLLLYDITIENKLINVSAKRIASITLEMLLFSGITDNILYSHVPDITPQQIFIRGFIPIVASSFCIILTLAFIYRTILDAILKWSGKAIHAISQRFKKYRILDHRKNSMHEEV